MDTLFAHLPPELAGFAVTLGLSLLIGFEREEHRPANSAGFFGGIRTFPMIGLAGFLLVEAFDTSIPFAVGLLVLGLLLAVTHWGSVQSNELGLTTEFAALLTFGLGAAAAHELYRLALAVGIVAATNNLTKGIYALWFGSKRTGRTAFATLSCVGLASVVLFILL